MLRQIFVISIHALLAESDTLTDDVSTGGKIFLSTLSLRRATAQSSSYSEYLAISIHALLAESDHYDNYNLHCVEISIHALLAESDSWPRVTILLSLYFYPRSPCGERLFEYIQAGTGILFLSTLSLRRATTWHRGSRITYVISIHALLAESDFNRHIILFAVIAFLSTLSLRRATGS